MNFQSPASLLWFLPIGGFILALYLLRMRRRDFVVPASFLWPERQDEVRANSLFQKLRFNWLWVLQLLALAFLVAGLARWQVRQENVKGQVTVLVVDASASMQSTDVAPSRFEEAKKRAAAYAQAMQVGDQIAVIEAGATPRVLIGLDQESAKVKQAIENLKGEQTPSDVGESLRLAMALVGRTEDAKVILLSDGCFEPLGSLSQGKAQVTYEQIGKSDENLAIQALGTAQTPKGLEAYVGIKNFGTKLNKTAVSVYADSRLIFSEEINLDAGQVVGRTMLVPTDAKIVRAKLSQGGFLKADDERLVPGNPSGAVRVLVVTKGNIFLETGLSLDSRVVVDKALAVPTGELAKSPGTGTYDLVIFDSMPEVAVKAPVVCTFGEGGSGSIVSVAGKVKSPPIVTSSSTGVMDGVSFADVYLDAVYTAQLKSGSRALAKTREGVLAAEKTSPKHQIYFAFDLLNSDFPLSISFPVLLANLVDLTMGEDSTGLSTIVTGQSVGLAARDSADLSVVDPAGTKTMIPALNGRYVLRNFSQTGVYQVGDGDQQKTYLVNLVSERESKIAPEAEVTLTGNKTVGTRVLERFADLWKPLIALMLAVLGLEWFIFMRRS